MLHHTQIPRIITSGYHNTSPDSMPSLNSPFDPSYNMTHPTQDADSPLTPTSCFVVTPRTRSGSSLSAYSLSSTLSGHWPSKAAALSPMKADMMMEQQESRDELAEGSLSPIAKTPLKSGTLSPTAVAIHPHAQSSSASSTPPVSRSASSFQSYAYNMPGPSKSASMGLPHRRQSRFDPMARDEEDLDEDGYGDLGSRHPLRRVQEESKDDSSVSLPSIRNLFSVAGEFSVIRCAITRRADQNRRERQAISSRITAPRQLITIAGTRFTILLFYIHRPEDFTVFISEFSLL